MRVERLVGETIVTERVTDNVDKRHSRPDTWLNDCASNVTSQYGEDGIIAKILEVIGETDRWCVEFGSWDGKHLSNTYNVVTNQGYSAVLIEGNADRFEDLRRTYKDNDRVVPVNAYVGFEPADGLDAILKDTSIPANFDLLCIDIDGNDYHVWAAVKEYRPKAVVIEFNPTIPAVVEFVQPRDMSVGQGNSLLSIAKLAKTKGYELVATTLANAFFVDEKYFPLFEIQDNSLSALWTDQSLVTHLFCGYDGALFIRGCGKLPWQQIPIEEAKMQVLPPWARERAGDRNFLWRKLGKYYRHRVRRK